MSLEVVNTTDSVPETANLLLQMVRKTQTSGGTPLPYKVSPKLLPCVELAVDGT